jgi:hypothetical protein
MNINFNLFYIKNIGILFMWIDLNSPLSLFEALHKAHSLCLVHSFTSGGPHTYFSGSINIHYRISSFPSVIE